MAPDPAPGILRRAHELAGPVLDAQARRLGLEDWQALAADLSFTSASTGGSLAILVAPLPMGHHLAITDGESDLPASADQFELAIMDADDHELVHVRQGGGGPG